MKKVIFMALATVFLLSSGFSSVKDSNSEDFYPCVITSTETSINWRTGKIETRTVTYTIYTVDFFDCMELQEVVTTIESGIK